MNAPFSPRKIASSAIAIAALAFGIPVPSPAQAVTVSSAASRCTSTRGRSNVRDACSFRCAASSSGSARASSISRERSTRNATDQGMSLQIGSTQATVNGQVQYLDVAPFIVGATTYVPLRFVAQSFGANVGYDSSSQTVTIGVPHGGGGYHPPVVRLARLPPPNPPPVSIVRLIAQNPRPGSGVANRFVHDLGRIFESSQCRQRAHLARQRRHHVAMQRLAPRAFRTVRPRRCRSAITPSARPDSIPAARDSTARGRSRSTALPPPAPQVQIRRAAARFGRDGLERF